MKNFTDDHLDAFFRKGLSYVDPMQVDEDWDRMKMTLLARKEHQTRRGFWFAFATSAAALILLALSTTFYFIQDDNSSSIPAGKTALKQIEDQEKDAVIAADKNLRNSLKVSDQHRQVMTDPLYGALSARIGGIEEETAVNAVEIADAAAPVADNPDTTSDQLILAVTRPGLLPIVDEVISSESGAAEPSDPLSPQTTVKSGKNRLSLAFNLAPDFSGVEHLQGRNLGYSIGGGLHYAVSDKLSMETELAFSHKSYQTGFAFFRPPANNIFPVMPNNVSAGFSLVDIQLNAAYRILSKGRYSVAAVGGISSYLMLDEMYSFDYLNQNAHGVRGFSTGYQNNHFLGIVNMGMRFNRSLTSNTQLSVSPYLKLPLTDLGYGNMRLRSAGVSFGVITNFSALKKK